MKKTVVIFFFSLLSMCLHGAEEESPRLSILEALKVALREVPEGKEIKSIELVRIDETTSIYYAVYDEKIIPYQRKKLNADGEYVEVTKSRKEDVAVEIASKDSYPFASNSSLSDFFKRLMRRSSSRASVCEPMACDSEVREQKPEALGY